MIVYCREADGSVPPISSPMWAEKAPSLRSYLGYPKSIDEIVEWASRQCIPATTIKNVLAWLSFQGQAKYDVGSKCWVQGSDYT